MRSQSVVKAAFLGVATEPLVVDDSYEEGVANQSGGGEWCPYESRLKPPNLLVLSRPVRPRPNLTLHTDIAKFDRRDHAYKNYE